MGRFLLVRSGAILAGCGVANHAQERCASMYSQYGTKKNSFDAPKIMSTLGLSYNFFQNICTLDNSRNILKKYKLTS